MILSEAKHLTLSEAKQRFDLRWTILAAALVLISSVSLVQLSHSSAAFVAFTAVGIALAGGAARRLLLRDDAVPHFMFVQKLRMITIAGIILIAAAATHANMALLMIIAAVALWLVSVSSFLQIGARFAPAHMRFFPYVQFIGDFWVALFLAFWGADWLIVAGALAFAACTAEVAVPTRDSRLLPVVVLAGAALFIFGIAPGARWFAIYVIAVISISAWSAHHLVGLANHSHGLTASVSDGSTAH